MEQLVPDEAFVIEIDLLLAGDELATEEIDPGVADVLIRIRRPCFCIRGFHAALLLEGEESKRGLSEASGKTRTGNADTHQCTPLRAGLRNRHRAGKRTRSTRTGAHGAALLEQLAAALPHVPPPGADARLKLEGLKPGVLVTLETLVPNTDRKGPSKIPLSFELPGQDVVILSSRRTEGRAEESIVFVPDDARAILTRRLQDYGNPGNRERPYVAQFEKVERIASADTAKLFDHKTDFNAPAQRWWELWVRDVAALPKALVAAARNFGLDVHPKQLLFPDTTVVFIHATARQALAFATRVPGAIEEIRPGLGTIEPFLVLGEGRVTQHDFVEDLAGRIIPAKSDAPTICVLDTGVAAAHPLLADGLAIALAVDEAWGVDDHYPHGGHGTSVASLALHGDLEHPMNDQRYLELTHTVESVKLLPPRGAPKTPPPSYGVVTQSAVSLIEISRPHAARSFCLASCYLDADARGAASVSPGR